jgi:hypothetical protein
MAKVLQDDIYLHLSSDDVLKILIPDNTASNFRVELPSTLILQGSWEIAVIEFICSFTSGIKYGDSLQILCDIIDASPIKDKWRPLLRNIIFENTVKRPDILLDFRYIKVAHSSIKRIGFQLLLNSIKSKIDERVSSFIVLHLRKSDN